MFPIPAREARQGIFPQFLCKEPTKPSISLQSGARRAAESGFLSVQGRSHTEASIPHCLGTEQLVIQVSAKALHKPSAPQRRGGGPHLHELDYCLPATQHILNI